MTITDELVVPLRLSKPKKNSISKFVAAVFVTRIVCDAPTDPVSKKNVSEPKLAPFVVAGQP